MVTSSTVPHSVPPVSPAEGAGAVDAPIAGNISPTPTQANPWAVFDLTMSRDLYAPAQPWHMHTESTLAPTAEFTRFFLLAWIVRYLFRGGSGMAFHELEEGEGIRNKILNACSTPGRWIRETFFKESPVTLRQLNDAGYALSMGVGSSWLSQRYNGMVHDDIMNLFRESVGYELDKTPEAVTFKDIESSKNHIVQRTVENYYKKAHARTIGDMLFLPVAMLRSGSVTDFLLGLKGLEIFKDTWKRKTTMFEDIVSFVNNKINLRNGLGQRIGTGEVFDLYQHYAESYAPETMFRKGIDQPLPPNESHPPTLASLNQEPVIWAKSQPIFQRITDLMNLTYAYKHSSIIDPKTGNAMPQADFPLPKFIYLLGQNLIDIRQPEKTLLLIEVANSYGMKAVKDAQMALNAGIPVDTLIGHYHVTLPKEEINAGRPPEKEKNAVISKGSSMQMEQVDPRLISPLEGRAMPQARIDAASIIDHARAAYAVPATTSVGLTA